MDIAPKVPATRRGTWMRAALGLARCAPVVLLAAAAGAQSQQGAAEPNPTIFLGVQRSAFAAREGPAGPVPRTADEKPDLSGIWNGQRALPGQPGPLMLPWAQKLTEEREGRHSADDLEARCLPGGPPRAAPYHYQIVQTPKLVLMLFEGNIHSYRQFFLDGSDHPKDLKPTWYGDSRAHWDGDTLVVDTVGFTDKSWIDMAGHPHTTGMHLIEKFHRRTYGTLEIENLIDDPGTYQKPWVQKRISSLETDPNLDMTEYVCNENNQDPGHLFGSTATMPGGTKEEIPMAGPVRRPPPAPKGPAPRRADGKVDLSGMWVLVGRPELPGDPSYQPWAQKTYEERKAAHGRGDPENQCLPDGVPRVNALPYKFVQTDKLLVVLPEGNTRAFRRIFLDGRGHAKDLDDDPRWSGDSIGRWDGDTLVVDTIGFNDRAWLDSTGKPHSDALHVTARYRRPDLGHLDVQYTLEDSKAFTRPYSFSRVFTLAPNWEIREYICMERLVFHE